MCLASLCNAFGSPHTHKHLTSLIYLRRFAPLKAFPALLQTATMSKELEYEHEHENKSGLSTPSQSFTIRPATSIPSNVNLDELSTTLSQSPWFRQSDISSSTTPKGSTGASGLRSIPNIDPPPYALHDLKFPGDVTFTDPWHTNSTNYALSKKITPDNSSSSLSASRSRPADSLNLDFRGLDNNLPLHTQQHKYPYTTPYDQYRQHRANLLRCLSVGQQLVHSEPFWLSLYFIFNLGLTLYNKIVLVTFPFPYTLTAVHTLFGSFGCYILQEKGYFTPARLTSKQNLILLGFSVLYAVNIAVSNISLQLVTVPFHQVVRAASPLFTLVLAYFMTGAKVSVPKLLSLLPVVAGVCFTTYGDYYFTAWGLFLTLFGTFLAALKTVVTNILQSGFSRRRLPRLESSHLTTGGTSSAATVPTPQGIKLHPLDLLGRMSPLAFIQCIIYGWASGELDRVRKFGATRMDSRKLLALCVNGMIAFGLNVVSFTANKKSGPLAMNVAANVKQVLTMLLAVFIFDLVITPMNILGILLTLAGGAWYAAVEYKEKQGRKSLVALTSIRAQAPDQDYFRQ